ncbi:MAG: low molecular weight protein arginine phosphatase [Chloroflexi bacterium]|nr:low molecular weight protein arginine phosphatase [Chloroflexota bacterium]
MAEGLIAARLAAEGRQSRLAVSSAGTWARAGEPATDKAVATLAERGIDIRAHRSREVTAELLDEADLVLVMTAGHREAILAEHPRTADKLRLMSELADETWDLADPVSQPIEAYRATATLLDRLIDLGWPRILGG